MQSRDTRFRETTTKSGLGPTFTVTSSVELWTSTRELRNFRGCHPCKLKCRVGRVGFGRRRQSRVLDRTFQLLLQLCIGLGRENLEIFGDAFHASSSEQLIQTYDGIFGLRLKCRVGILAFERRRLCRVLDLPLKLLVQLSFGLRQENLEIFVDAFHASINEQLIQTYYGIFGFRLKCRVGILGFERRRRSRVMDRPLQLLVKLCCGLRRENLEIFADAIHAIGFERRQQSRVLDRPLQLLVQLSFGLRRENLEIFVDAFHATINEHRLRGTTTKSGLGLTFTVTSSVELWTSTRELRNLCGCHPCNRLRGTTTKSGLGPTFTVTSSVELWTSTRELRNFRGCHPCNRFRETTTKSGLGPTVTVTTSVVLWISTRELRNYRGCHPCNRLRETTTKSGLGPTFTVTSSVELWTSTRELRNFRGCHPCKY
ncbi:hypothetical protein V1477_013477 [Vespula maculifrons]|uniref:Uncharacterized protein n=1 Tax=Vespula maculifrons TaxID=7453 RepID=A0ABD2BQ92_VESMC